MFRIIVFSIFILISSSIFAQITFTEVMFDSPPAYNENHDEFVEIFNLSFTDSLYITGWQFSDSSASDYILPVNADSLLAPRSFAVILDGSYFGNSTVCKRIIPDTIRNMYFF